jgi:hypothetical protein
MTLPTAEDVLLTHVDLIDNGVKKWVTKAMKEYARQVLDYAAEVDNLPECTKVNYVRVSSILKIKDEL